MWPLNAWGYDILIFANMFQKNYIVWPHQPPTENFLRFKMIFHDSTKEFWFQNIEIKLSSRTWMTMESSVVIFQALEPLQPHWPQRPLQTHWPHQPLQPYFIKRIPDPDGCIIPSTKMTNTGPFLWNGSSKVQFFTDSWYPFCRRLLRPVYVTFLKTGFRYQNVITSGI